MAYNTQAELINKFGSVELAQLTDRINHLVIDSTVLDSYNNRAADFVDGYLSAGGYLTPVLSATEAIKGAAADLWRWYAYEDQATEEVYRRAKLAIEWLEDVANRKVILPIPSPSTFMGISVNQRERIFTESFIGRF